MASFFIGLVAIYVILAVLQFKYGWLKDSRLRGRIAIAIMFFIAGTLHFLARERLIAMLPTWVPAGETIVLLTGMIEIFGALFLLYSSTARVTALVLSVYLIAVFPANVQVALQSTGALQFYAWLRLPFQAVFILWLLWCTNEGSSIHERLFAWMNMQFEKKVEPIYAPFKKKLFEDLRGTVVEIGSGTGSNLRYIPRNVDLLAVEPSEVMCKHLKERAHEHDMIVHIYQQGAEHIPLDDKTADFVISTLVLCSVPFTPIILKEVQRVLKPGGKFLFIEHVASEKEKLKRWQDRINPFWRWFARGCECNRATAEAIEQAGFSDVSYHRHILTKTSPLIKPHIVGYAVK